MVRAPKQAGSLRINLLFWLFGPVVVILCLSLWLSFATAKRHATLVMDGQLMSSARMIAEQTRYRQGAIRVVMPPAALELFATESHDEVAYAVFAADGTLIAGFPDLALPDPLGPALVPKSFPTKFRTENMRAIVVQQSVITPDGEAPIVVMVGETLKSRDAMVQALWSRGFLEQAALVVAAALSIWIGITLELRPLLRLQRKVQDTPADKLEPLTLTEVHREIRPLVEALNDRMARLAANIARQRRFLDSSAHQMRTPLSVLKLQVGAARRSNDAATTAATLAEIDASLSAMSRLMSQLLTLGRVEHERGEGADETVDLSDLARDVASHIAPLALDAGIELAVEADAPCLVAASGLLLREAISNLIDNTIAHAGAGAVATLRVAAEGPMGVLTISDTGRGVSKPDRARIFRRFQRGGSAVGSGSGLGLAIVAEISAMFGGSAAIMDTAAGQGFAVRLALPLA